MFAASLHEGGCSPRGPDNIDAPPRQKDLPHSTVGKVGSQLGSNAEFRTKPMNAEGKEDRGTRMTGKRVATCRTDTKTLCADNNRHLSSRREFLVESYLDESNFPVDPAREHLRAQSPVNHLTRNWLGAAIGKLGRRLREHDDNDK